MTLTAVPAPARALTGWTVDGQQVANRNPLSLTMNRDHAVVAAFDCAVKPRGQVAAARSRAERLGCATSPQRGAAAGGAAQLFEHGAVYWSPRSGAHPLWGPVYAKWQSLRAERGSLGYPVSDPRREVNSRGVEGVCQSFRHGVICWSPKTGAHPVQPPLLGHWQARGAVKGKLGFPVADARRITRRGGLLPVGGDSFSGLVQDFEGGLLIHDAKSGKARVQPS